MRTIFSLLLFFLSFAVAAQTNNLNTPEQFLRRIIERHVNPTVITDTTAVAVFDITKNADSLTVVAIFNSAKESVLLEKLHVGNFKQEIPDGFRRIVPVHSYYVPQGQATPKLDASHLADAAKVISGIDQKLVVTKPIVCIGYQSPKKS